MDWIIREIDEFDQRPGDRFYLAPEDRAETCFIARHPMTVVGMATVAARVFHLLDPTVSCTDAVADGSRVEIHPADARSRR